jgi:hypothetical protein
MGNKCEIYQKKWVGSHLKLRRISAGCQSMCP